jgi:hypothetical protein
MRRAPAALVLSLPTIAMMATAAFAKSPHFVAASLSLFDQLGRVWPRTHRRWS